MKSELNSKTKWYQKIAPAKRIRLFWLEFKRDVRGDPTIKTKTTKSIARWLNNRKDGAGNTEAFEAFWKSKNAEIR